MKILELPEIYRRTPLSMRKIPRKTNTLERVVPFRSPGGPGKNRFTLQAKMLK
jgi:hypothetical protein